MPKADQSALTSMLAVTVETCCDDTSGMCAGNADAFAGGELRSLDGLYAFACGSGYALKDDAYHIALGALADQRASRCCTAVRTRAPDGFHASEEPSDRSCVSREVGSALLALLRAQAEDEIQKVAA